MITYTGVLLNLDGVVDSQGDVFDDTSSIELPSREVDVTLDFHRETEFWLGTAKLFFRPGKLCYRMHLDDTRLPKYALETLIPCAGGSIVKRDGKHITHAFIKTIGLTSYQNCDTRIKRLKDQDEI